MKLELYKAVIESCNDSIVITDATARDQPIIYANQAFIKLTGYAEEEIIGRNCRFLQGEDNVQEQVKTIKQHLNQGKSVRVVLKNYKKSGELFWNELSISPVYDDNKNLQYFIGVQNDVTEKIKQSTELKKLTLKDPLTKLYNRKFIQTEFQRVWYQAIRDQFFVSVILIDIDYFKQFNDYYGHIQGDLCLINIAGVISSHFRRYTDAVIRFGGEEFLIFISNAKYKNVKNISEKLRKKVEDLKLENKGVNENSFITLSIGVYHGVPNKNISINDYIEKADKALYMAKNSGRNKIQDYGE